MSHPNSVFKPHSDTIKKKIYRLMLTLVFYVPVWCLLYTSSWYVNKQMPIWVSDYFNVSTTQKMADLTNMRVQIAEKAMSFPIGVTSYVSAQIDNMAASTKASTLSFAAQMTTSLLQGITYVLFLIFNIYMIFRFIKSYKAKSSEDHIAQNVVNILLPALQEINQNIKNQNRGDIQ